MPSPKLTGEFAMIVRRDMRKGPSWGPFLYYRPALARTFQNSVSPCPAEAPVGIEPTNSRFAVRSCLSHPLAAICILLLGRRLRQDDFVSSVVRSRLFAHVRARK